MGCGRRRRSAAQCGAVRLDRLALGADWDQALRPVAAWMAAAVQETAAES